MNSTTIYKQFTGVWLALAEDEGTVVGNGNTVRAALADARKAGHRHPILANIPTQVYFASFPQELPTIV